MPLLVALLAVGGTSHAQPGPKAYLCVADLATGFQFKNKQWSSVDFRTSNKYLFSKTDSGWELKEVGSSSSLFQCGKDFTQAGNLFCRSLFAEFRFNKDSLRFLNAYLVGYWSDGKPRSDPILGVEGDNSPSLEIGKCSPL